MKNKGKDWLNIKYKLGEKKCNLVSVSHINYEDKNQQLTPFSIIINNLIISNLRI